MLQFLSALLGIIVVGVIYLKWVFTYWKKRNVQCFEEPTIPLGNLLLLWKENFLIGNYLNRIYGVARRKGYKHVGLFSGNVPLYVPVDPLIIKSVLVQGFDNFPQRLYGENRIDDVFAGNMVFACGERWKFLRGKSAPAFTASKIKILLDGIVHCGQQMHDELESQNKKGIDFLKVSLNYFTDVLGLTVYGIECNSFKNENSEFINHAGNIIKFNSTYRIMKYALKFMFPKIYDLLGIRLFSDESCEFFFTLARETAKFRKNNNLVRKDLFHFLMDAEKELNVEEIDDETSKSSKIIKDLACQLFAYFVGGFESSSSTMTFCLYQLTQNLKIQEKLREEIDRVLLKHEGKITYDAISEMNYMNQVLNETLRKYPSLAFLSRRCVKECKIDEAIIEKGMLVLIPVLGLHHDPEYFPDPEKFDPERFSEENKNNIVPFTYLPFGEGPRICPAYRFGLMQLKVGLTVLLRHYTFTLNKKTKIPIDIDPGRVVSKPISEVLLDITNRYV